MLNAEPCNELAKATCETLKLLVTADEFLLKQTQLINECCDFLDAIQTNVDRHLESFNLGMKYSVRLRHMFDKTTGVLK